MQLSCNSKVPESYCQSSFSSGMRAIIVSMRLFLFLLCCFSFVVPLPVQAQNPNTPQEQEIMEGEISRIVVDNEMEVMGKLQRHQILEIHITRGSQKGQTVTVEHGDLPLASLPVYQVGERVKVSRVTDTEGGEVLYISDYVRRGALLPLFLIFVFCAIGVARWRGVMSIISMGYSFLIILYGVLPGILAGNDPVLVAVLGALAIVPVTFYLSHGVNKKTTASIIGTVFSLIITGILTAVFTQWAHITGTASEEASYLQVYLPGAIHLRGLLLAGIMIGTLGVMDDITISQASVVEQLRLASSAPIRDVFRRAMEVGRDHIASLVNTLVLVYAGASLPLLLLFVHHPSGISFMDALDLEIVAEEIVRTLVGSIGLIIAVPLTTLIACWFLPSKAPRR